MTAHSPDSQPVPPNQTPGTALVPAAAPGWAADPQPAPAAPPASGAVLIAALWQAFLRRWAVALTLGLLAGGAVAAAMWYSTPPLYTGRTLLEVALYPPSIIADRDISNVAIGLDNLQRAQLAWLRSRVVLNRALRDPKVAELPIVRQQADPLAWLEGQVGGDFATAPEHMAITMSGPDPQTVTLVLNALRDAYIEEINDADRRHRTARLERRQKVFDDIDAKIRQKKKTLKDLADDLGGHNDQVLAQRQILALKQLEAAQGELIDVQKKLRGLRLGLELQLDDEKVAKQPIPDALLDDMVAKHPDVIEVQQRIAQTKKTIDEFMARAVNPKGEKGYQNLVKQLDTQEKELAQKKERLLPELRKKARDDRVQEARASRATTQRQIDQMEKLERLLDDEVTRLIDRTRVMGKKANDVGWLKDEIGRIEGIWKSLGDTIAVERIDQDAPDRAHKIEDAVVRSPAQNKMRNASLAGMAVLAALVGGITLLEYRSRKVTGPDEVSGNVPVRLVGSLPMLPRRLRRGHYRPGSRRDLFWRNLLTESVDTTRTMVVRDAERHGLRVLMVTSALAAEGKTMLSSHLAASLARAGRKTLLIDCDLRRPAVRRVFNLPAHAGICEVLRGEAALADTIQPGPIPGLSLIATGRVDALAVQALSHCGLAASFASLRAEFDFVIVDSAPVLPVTDSQLIGQCADGVLLVVMREVSRLPAVTAAYERLLHLGIRVVGTVMHGGMTASQYGYAYGYGDGESAAYGGVSAPAAPAEQPPAGGTLSPPTP